MTHHTVFDAVIVPSCSSFSHTTSNQHSAQYPFYISLYSQLCSPSATSSHLHLHRPSIFHRNITPPCQLWGCLACERSKADPRREGTVEVLDRFSQVDLPVIPSGQHCQHDLHIRSSSSQVHACLAAQLLLENFGTLQSGVWSQSWRESTGEWGVRQKQAGEKSGNSLRCQDASSAAVLLHRGTAAAIALRRKHAKVQMSSKGSLCRLKQ